jgi:hypothetical protein
MYMCVWSVSILPLSTIFLLEFWNFDIDVGFLEMFQLVWYFLMVYDLLTYFYIWRW